MFGPYTEPERPKIRVPGAWTAAAFAVSAVFHVGLIAWIARSHLTIKILSVPSEVREIYIAPRLPAVKLMFPKAGAKASARPAVSAETEISAGTPLRGATGRPSASEPVPGPMTSSAARAPMIKSGPSGPPPSPLPEIRLHFGAPSDARGVSDLVLIIPAPGQTGIRGQTPAAPPGKEVEDLWAYLYPEIPGGSGLPGGRGAGRGRGAVRRGGGGPSAGAAISIKDPALVAWAGAALSVILAHWNLPADLRTTERIRVEITAVILASGEVTSFHILSSSRNIPFDQSALEALRASVPFPAFPETLPYSSIEIRFFFENNG
jgi:TonB family protein